MSDLPTPAPAPSSVVVDTNATVKKSRVGIIVAAVLVVAFVAFSIVWFATREDYQPGRAARAVVEGMREDGIDAELSDDQLQCIDDLFAGTDPSFLDGESFDPVNAVGDDPESDRLAGRMFDDCFDRPARVAVFAASMVADGSATEEQADCAATVFDDAFVGAGGYEAVFTDAEQMAGLAFGLFGALAECGIDVFGGMDDATFDTTDFAACDVDFNIASTALDAYQADNGKNAESWDDLVPDLLYEDYSDRFTIEAGADGSVTLTGIGDCEGYSYSIGA